MEGNSSFLVSLQLVLLLISAELIDYACLAAVFSMLDVLSTLDSQGSCLSGVSDPPVLVEHTGLLRNRCKLLAEMVGLEQWS